jgi:hypothetical protein
MTPILVVTVSLIIRRFSFSRLPAVVEVLSCLGSVLAGATVSGFLLARLTNEDTTDFVRQGVGYSIAFTMLHLMVVFAIMTLLVSG